MSGKCSAAQLSRGVALLLVLVLVSNWELVWILARQLFTAPFGVLVALIAAHLVLLVGSIVGLYRLRPWGFYYVYLMIPFSTVMLGISFVPWLARPFPFPINSALVAIFNLGVLATVVTAHVRYRRELDVAPNSA